LVADPVSRTRRSSRGATRRHALQAVHRLHTKTPGEMRLSRARARPTGRPRPARLAAADALAGLRRATVHRAPSWPPRLGGFRMRREPYASKLSRCASQVNSAVRSSRAAARSAGRLPGGSRRRRHVQDTTDGREAEAAALRAHFVRSASSSSAQTPRPISGAAARTPAGSSLTPHAPRSSADRGAGRRRARLAARAARSRRRCRDRRRALSGTRRAALADIWVGEFAVWFRRSSSHAANCQIPVSRGDYVSKYLSHPSRLPTLTRCTLNEEGRRSARNR